MVVARRFLQVMVAAGMVLGTIVASNGREDQVAAQTETLRDGFETGQPIWQREYKSVRYATLPSSFVTRNI